MKRFILIGFLFFVPSISFGANFSDLDKKCLESADGQQYSQNTDKLVLKHINGKITKSEWYVKYDDYLYIFANTFSDNYRFLGAYLLRYDCKEKTTATLSPLLKKNFPWELWFMSFDDTTGALMLQTIGSWNYRAVWIYDLNSLELKTINSRKLKIPKGKKLSWQAKLDTYDGSSIRLELLYYTGNYQYENYNSPEIFIYRF